METRIEIKWELNFGSNYKNCIYKKNYKCTNSNSSSRKKGAGCGSCVIKKGTYCSFHLWLSMTWRNSVPSLPWQKTWGQPDSRSPSTWIVQALLHTSPDSPWAGPPTSLSLPHTYSGVGRGWRDGEGPWTPRGPCRRREKGAGADCCDWTGH